MAIIANYLLFNHTYLRRLQADCSLDEQASLAAQGVRDWYGFRDDSSIQSMVDSWVGPLLNTLELELQPLNSDDSRVHLLYTAWNHTTPVGLCYVVPSGADLDMTTKGQHWMAEAVLAARNWEPPEGGGAHTEAEGQEEQSLPWVILTNGDQWRLLDAQALRRYEAYLQVDLQELVRDPGELSALRVFYRCFHRSAFERDSEGESGLDRLLEASSRATKKAEDHLKACVSANEGVMAQLCLGLVESTGKDRFTEDERDAIYRDATYLLYRMLFILYAEARDLLPMDNPAYRQTSLNRLVENAHEYKLKGIPDPNATTLWDQLKQLCNAIYESDEALGIPAYNGGLFDDADKPYLRKGTMADGHLTQALVDLAYQPDGHVDDGYRRIDYRDLSVRHLGSIYEGMIEYKLQIAEETLWARRDGKGNVRFLKTDQDGAPRRNDMEIKMGEVYFSQSPGERRATGTYYTPEFVVDYIVRQTVVHGLEERRASLEERLRSWSEEVAAAIDQSEEERMQRTADDELLRFVEEEVLTFRVCDPAMGSGHFLVNAAHHIAAFIVETVHLAPWERPTIDSDPVAWRRRVVERCLYGVDISLMAVELAKLSLWLASVAERKPLSFLNHHLRQGDSLIGARLEDLAQAVSRTTASHRSNREQRERAAGQLSMMDDRAFSHHVTAATDLLIQISTRLGDKVEDVKAQETDYERVRSELEAYRRLADLLTACHFGLAVDDKRSSIIAKSVITGAISLSPENRRVLAEAQELGQWRHFFHWELEFPEVFLHRRSGSSYDQTGFAVVIGNPPYVRQERLSDQKAYLRRAFPAVYSGIADLYVFFVAQALKILAAGGRLGMIMANKWLRADYAAPLRACLARSTEPKLLLDFGHSDVFPSTDTFPCILIVGTHDRRQAKPLFFADVSDRVRGSTPLREHVERHGFEVPTVNLQKNGWLLEPPAVSELLKRLQSEYPTLGDQPGVDAFFGIKTGFNKAFYIDTSTHKRLLAADRACKPLLRKLLRGRTIRRWRPAWGGEWIIAIPSSANRTWPWSDCADDRVAEEIFRTTFPALHSHLKPHETRLRRRHDQGSFWWELRSCKYYDALDKPKIVAKRILFHSSFCLDKQSHWVNDSTVFLNTDDLYILAVLNSRVLWWYIYRLWPHMKDEALRVQNEKWLSVPIPEVNAQERTEVETLTHQALALAGDPGPDLYDVEQRLHECILEAFRFGTADIAVIEQTLPMRDPLEVLQDRLQR